MRGNDELGPVPLLSKEGLGVVAVQPECPKDNVKYGFQVCEDVIIADSEDTQTLVFHEPLTNWVVQFGHYIAVAVSIQFYHQTRRGTVEVYDIPSDSLLAAEFEPKLANSKAGPQ